MQLAQAQVDILEQAAEHASSEADQLTQQQVDGEVRVNACLEDLSVAREERDSVDRMRRTRRAFPLPSDSCGRTTSQ